MSPRSFVANMCPNIHSGIVRFAVMNNWWNHEHIIQFFRGRTSMTAENVQITKDI